MRAYGSGFHLGITPVVLNIIIINVLMFLLKNVMHQVDLDNLLGLFALQSPNFRPWQLVTHMFMHADAGHIFGNMFGLFMFGSALERLWGAKRFLTYYLLTGLGAAVLQLGANTWTLHQDLAAVAPYNVELADVKALSDRRVDDESLNMTYQHLLERTGLSPTDEVGIVSFNEALKVCRGDLFYPMIGASGAIFGILLAFGMMFPNEIIYFQLFIPIKAKYFVAIFGLLEFYYGVHGAAGDPVAHFAHLGGMIFGFFLVRHWKRTMIL